MSERAKDTLQASGDVVNRRLFSWTIVTNPKDWYTTAFLQPVSEIWMAWSSAAGAGGWGAGAEGGDYDHNLNGRGFEIEHWHREVTIANWIVEGQSSVKVISEQISSI